MGLKTLSFLRRLNVSTVTSRVVFASTQSESATTDKPFASASLSRKNDRRDVASVGSSTILTNVIDVQTKNFERELWDIYDSDQNHAWISKSRLEDLRKKISDVKSRKKRVNPLLLKQKRLMNELKRLELENAPVCQSDRLKRELDDLAQRLSPMAEELKSLQAEVFDEIVFYPNARPSPHTGCSDQILLTSGERRQFPFSIKSHAQMQDVAFRSDVGPYSTYFLTGNAALAEMAIIERTEDFLLDAEFHPFCSMPDILKGAVIIGCGSSTDEACFVPPIPSGVDGTPSDEDEKAAKNPKYLLGGSSLYAFSAFFTKMLFRTGRANVGIPLRLFSSGRHFAQPELGRPPSLFNRRQSWRLSLFGVPPLEAVDEEFERFSNTLVDLYRDSGLPFRLIEVGRDNLRRGESRRRDVEVWSPANETYYACGSVSNHNDYISNRLLINTRRANNFPCQIISGVACDVGVFLGAIMENGQRSDGTWSWPGILD